MIEILMCTPDDWRVVRAVRLSSLADSPDAFTSSHERESAFDEAAWRDRVTTCRWFVASERGEPVGVAGGIPGHSGDPSRRELVGMWVAATHRHRGLARSLLDHVAEWARTEGATTLDLGVRTVNGDSRAAYLRMGLRLTGETTPDARDPSVAIEHMELRLGSE